VKPAEALDDYVHEALFFGSTQDLVAEAAPFLRAGLAAGDDVVLICEEENNQAVAKQLGHDERIIYFPRPGAYQKAVTAVQFYRDFMRSRLEQGSRRVRLVGQVNFGTDPRAWDEWRRFEALCNHALSSYPLWCLCAYDVRDQPSAAVATAEITHPFVRHGEASRVNPGYVDPAALLRVPPAVLRPLPEDAPTVALCDLEDLNGLHRRVRERLVAARLEGELVDDLVLVVNELATNGIRHGVPPVTVRMRLTEHRVVCTVVDRGPGFDDPYAGYLPGNGAELPEGQFGLWLARRLCDQLLVDRTPEGFAVTLVVDR
jgi:anti-sigma regulatory factor (Ser/Thr protein kinase)